MQTDSIFQLTRKKGRAHTGITIVNGTIDHYLNLEESRQWC